MFLEKHNKNKVIDNKIKIAIGLMSGTSADGVDASIISTNGRKIFDFGDFLTIDYNKEERQLIKSAYRIDLRNCSLEEKKLVEKVSNIITEKHIYAVNAILEKMSLNSDDVDVVGFHGQTIVHKPSENYTLQIGDAQKLCKETKIDVVYDFRSNDVKNGGQGAPLIPVYHRVLTKDEPKPLVVLNIGGVANLTYIGKNEDDMLGFDTGTGNAMINDWVYKYKALEFDDKGKIAKSGKLNKKILEKLTSHEFFNKKPPKSLDRNDFIKELELELKDLSFEDGVRTLSEFSVYGVKKAFDFFVQKPEKIIVVGGGAYNDFLLERIEEVCKTKTVSYKNDQKGYNPNRIESDGFALMAARRIYDMPISWKKTTGVNLKSCIGGKFCMA